MTLSLIALLAFTGVSVVCTLASTPAHDFHYVYGCYESDGVRVDILIDGDVVGYADFNKQEIVWGTPHLPESVKERKKEVYETASASTAYCHIVMKHAKTVAPGSPMRQDAPDSYMYTRYEEEDGVINTLYCVANHFYPPTLNFTWTKNGAEVRKGVLNLRYRYNSDGTFHRISTLRFTPRQGDVFSCSVEHQALQRPLVRSWELKESKSSMSPAAGFFLASLVLCLIGIGTGLFLFNKTPN